MKAIDRLKFRFFGKKGPIVRFSDNGNTVEFVESVNYDVGGILRETWNGTGYEVPDGVRPIKIILKNREMIGYAVSEKGVAVNVEDRTKLLLPEEYIEKYPNLSPRAIPGTEETHLKYEGVIGELTSGHMIKDGIDLEPNDRQMWINRIIFLLIGWFVIAPMAGSMF
mgnify:CR=1 FL=1